MKHNSDVFCQIVNKEHPAEIIAEGEDWLAVKDIKPSTPTHVLVIPKKHISGIAEVKEGDKELLGEMLLAVKNIAKDLGIAENGYRVVINQGQWGGQTVDHLHIHILGGRQMGDKLAE